MLGCPALIRPDDDPIDSRERLGLGQWFTPPDVADLVLGLVLPEKDSQRADPRLRVLDPACGEGVFLARARSAGVRGECLFGCEIESRALQVCRQQLEDMHVVEADFFTLRPEQGLFDVVVGNPPYVRQERLDDATKHQVKACLSQDWLDHADLVEQLGGQSDLTTGFLLHSIRLLRPGGRLGFVVSVATLDAKYGRGLWDLVNRVARVVAIVDAPKERWFADAAVNTMIVVIERVDDQSGDVAVARLTQATKSAARMVRGIEGLAGCAEVTSVPIGAPQTWRRALRASSVWNRFCERAGDRLVPLGKVAKVRRGITSGANDIFYLTRKQAAAHGIEQEFLRPLLRSPREQRELPIMVDSEQTSHVAIVCSLTESEMQAYPGIRAYWAGHLRRSEQPTLRARTPWYALPVTPSRIFLTKAYAARFVQCWARSPVVADQRLYSVHPHGDVDEATLVAILNSTFTAFALESLGRASLGEGALEWTVGDAAKLPIIDPRRFGATEKGDVHRALELMGDRPIGAVWHESTQDDRRRLDRAVSGALGVENRSLDELHQALIGSVRNRHTRAGSV